MTAEPAAPPSAAPSLPSPTATAAPLSPTSPLPSTFSPTTAEISGGGKAQGLTDRAQSILTGAAGIASWLGDQGQKALQAILVTEGGMNNARGDNSSSAGPLQFFGEEGGRAGQLNAFAASKGMSLAQARSYVEQNPLEAVQFAIGTPDRPGYLGGALAAGLSKGLQGPALATYGQEHGQVSVTPERAGQNFNALFSTGGPTISGGAQLTPGMASDFSAPSPNSATTNLSQPTTMSSNPLEDFTSHVQQVTGGAISTLGSGMSTMGGGLQDFASHVKQATGGLVDLTGGSIQTLGSPGAPTPSDSLTNPPLQTGLPTQQAAGLPPPAGMGATGGAIPPAAPPPPPPPEPSMWDKLGQGMADLFKSTFGRLGAGAGTLAQGQESVGQGATQAADATASGVGHFLTDPQPWMQNVVGAQTKDIQANAGISPYEPGAQQLTQPEQYAQARGIATGLSQTLVPEDLAARATTTGAGSLAQSADVAGDLAQSRAPGQIFLGGPVPPTPPSASAGPAWRAATSADAANQAVGTMLTSKPPQPSIASLSQRLVTATTNRFAAADRFQQDRLIAQGLDPKAPPETLDLSARLRLSTDPAADIRIQTGLKPAVQAAGDEQEALSAYLIHQNNVDVAAALGNANRKFSGGLQAADSQAALQTMQTELGPQRWAQVQDAANQVYQFGNSLRQRMVDSGLISADTAAQWQQDYPHWVPTRILDYLDSPAAQQSGSKISLGNNGVKAYTLEGTAKFREDPIASLVGLTEQVEARARKNEAVQALLNLDSLGPTKLIQKTDKPVPAQSTVVQFVNHGTVERYVAPPELAAVINGPNITQAPGFVRAWTNFVRSVTTVLSPTFALVRNPSLDVPEYFTRELARSGGNPLALPGITAQLFKGYGDAMQGLLQGEVRGAGSQQFLLGGGGQSGMIGNSFGARANTVQSLQRSSPFEITGIGDIGRIVKDIATLKPVAALAERTEMGPRVASMRLAEQRGAGPQQAILAGRTVTLDFNEGGTLAKTLNSFIPFFNAGVQGTMVPVRMFHENPVGTIASITGTIGLPAVAAQAWNRADPQRSADYEDVPQYLKDQGIVVMLPGDAPVDKDGNRKPQFWWVNTRGYAPFAIAARQATDAALQSNPEDAGALSRSLFWSTIPIRANTVGDVPGSVMPQFLPGATTGLQLAQNRDFFRGSDIVSKRNDERAPQLAREIADAVTAMARLQNPAADIHPSQVDFAVRDMLGGVGASIMGGRSMLPGAEPVSDSTPQNMPLLGGAVKALGVRGDTGAQLQNVKNAGIDPKAQTILNTLGLNPPGAGTGTLSVGSYQVPLRQTEETQYTRLVNQHASDMILQQASTLGAITDPVERQRFYDRILQFARDQARVEVLSNVPTQDLSTRATAATQAKRAPVPVASFAAPVVRP